MRCRARLCLQILAARLPAASGTGSSAPVALASAVPVVPTIIVAGLVGVHRQQVVDYSECNGSYTEVRRLSDRPLYRKVGGDAIIYFRDYWKMNTVDAVGGWFFDVKGAKGPLPPMGAWEQSGYPSERPAKQASKQGVGFRSRPGGSLPTLSWKPAGDDA